MRTKTAIIVLVAILTVTLGALAFLIGIMLGNQKQDETVQTAVLESKIISSTEVQNTTAETANDTTAEVTTVVTTQTEAETTTATAVTEPKKPTVTNAYLFWTNTGVGINLYLHVEGDFSAYSYKLYFSLFGRDEYTLDRTGGGIDTESLIATGLGVPDTFKALVTFWNQDKSQSTEQWVYIDDAKSDGYSQQPVSAQPAERKYLQNGFVMTKNADLNLRSQPNTNSEILKKIPKTTFLCLYESGTNGWYWTEYDGTGGYVSAEYVYDPTNPALSGTYYQSHSCLLYGEINTHGSTVPGYTVSRILPNGDVDSVVRYSLGNGWHVVSNQYQVNPEATYYELYDSQDGDFYGWVDETFIDWYS